MPQQTVYIRNADMVKWKALENKAAFISEHLNKKPEPSVYRKPDNRGTALIDPYDNKPIEVHSFEDLL